LKGAKSAYSQIDCPGQGARKETVSEEIIRERKNARGLLTTPTQGGGGRKT